MAGPAPFTYASASDWICIIFGALISALGGITMPYFLSSLGDMMDAMNGLDQKRTISYYAVLQVILGAITWACCLVGVTLFSWAAGNQVERMSNQYMTALLRQSMSYIGRQEGGKLAARAAAGVSSIRHTLGIKLSQLCFSIAFAIGGFVVSLTRNWKLGLVIACMLPVNLIVFVAVFITLSWADRLKRRSYESAAAVLEECMQTLRTIVSFGLEARFTELFEHSLMETARTLIQAQCWAAIAFTGMFGCFYFTEALGFWYGAKLISDDIDRHGIEACILGTASCTTGGEVLAVFMTFLQGIFALAQCSPNLGALAAARSAMKDFTSVIESEVEIEIDDPQAPSFPDAIEGAIEFKGITFRYPNKPDNFVYSDLSLKVPPGQCIALVGSSGCGKSTLVQLLQRFYDVEEGSIEVDGHNIKEYNLMSLRKHMALVSQEPRLFATSILENIRVGRLDATDSECEEAAKQAYAHHFIQEFPQGYSTFVGEGGGQLSGGQKQRIAIARAILRNPAILILDEATSALDNESEKVVQQALNKLLAQHKRTTIIIAHRLSTIRTADRIAVFDKISDSKGSRLAELGSHQELMERPDGLYAQFVKSQDLPALQDAADIVAAHHITDLPARAQSLAAVISDYKLKSANSKHLAVNGQESRCGGWWRGQKKRQRANSSSDSPVAGDPLSDASEEDLSNVTLGRQLGLLNYCPLLSILSVIFGLIDGAVLPCYVILFSKFMKTFYLTDAQEMRRQSHIMSMWLAIMGVLAWFIASVRMASSSVNNDRVIRALRIELFTHLMHMDVGFFDDPLKASSSYLSDVMAADPPAAAAAICSNAPVVASALSAIITALVISLIASVKLALVALAGFFILGPAAFLQSQLTMPSLVNATDLNEAGAVDIQTTSYVLLESLLNFRVVQAYSLQERMADMYAKYVRREKKKGFSSGVLSGGAWGFTQFLQFATLALIFWYGGRLVTGANIDVAQMWQGSNAIMMAAATIGVGSFFAGDAAAGRRGLSRIFTIQDRHSLADPRDQSGRQISKLETDIEVKDLCFSYPMRPDRAVYNDLSLKISKGETVALVGASGCGKSTLIQLLQRFYILNNDALVDLEGKPAAPPSSGQILIDGNDLQTLNLKSWRKCIGMVQQEPLLFTTTIRENIALGNFESECSEEMIQNAAKMANAHDFISVFDHGYDTHVGTRGGELSGGQKQRVAIARALIRNPSILILDEATSALDSESEKVVQEALDKVIDQGQRTTIIIAHRLSTIRKADKIVVLKNLDTGSIVAETGTHEELLKIPNGVYYNLARLAAHA